VIIDIPSVWGSQSHLLPPPCTVRQRSAMGYWGWMKHAGCCCLGCAKRRPPMMLILGTCGQVDSATRYGSLRPRVRHRLRWWKHCRLPLLLVAVYHNRESSGLLSTTQGSAVSGPFWPAGAGTQSPRASSQVQVALGVFISFRLLFAPPEARNCGG